MDIDEIQKYVSIFKDIISGLSALFVAITAFLGLHTWKKQIKGRNEYELIQKLLRATYKVRESIAWVRNPFESVAEISQALKDSNIEGDYNNNPRIRARKEGAVYENRWRKVQEALIDLDSVALEAEAIWGDKVSACLKPLRTSVSTLAFTITSYLQTLERPNDNLGSEYSKYLEKIIYDWPDESNENTFSKELSIAVNIIEEFLRPRLKI